MLNDRDDKIETPEESEYHFSDEDVSYEVEPEAAKLSPPPVKESLLNRLSKSKRMIISLVVFLVLVFVVYKMVSPGTSENTDIAPPIQKATSQTITNVPSLATTVTTPAPTTVTVVAPTEGPQPPPTVTIPTMKPQVATVQTSTITQTNTVPAAPPAALQLPVAPQIPAAPAAAVASVPAAPAIPAAPAVAVAQAAPTPSLAEQAAVPNVVPMQSPPTSTTPGFVSTTSTATPLSSQVPGGVDSAVAQLAASNEKLAAQLRADYMQRLDEFAAQNKNLQNQVQTLTVRLTTMEAEMQKLLQTLLQSNGNTEPKVVERQVSVSPGRILPYSVQAIIPGRAWLRADNGETVTVAEGDMIRGAGRVVKIDPYDGVVEVNTGNKVVSLSYGNGN